MQCSAPVQADMQCCANCGLSIETMASGHSSNDPKISRYSSTAFQETLASTSTCTQAEKDELVPDYRSSQRIFKGATQAPRFPPASPLPLEPDEWNECNDRNICLCWYTQQKPLPLPEAISVQEQENNLDLIYEPEKPGGQLIEAQSPAQEQCSTSNHYDAPLPLPPAQKQRVMSNHYDTTLADAIAPTPRRIRIKEEISPPRPSDPLASAIESYQLSKNIPIRPVKAPQPSPQLAPDPGRQNAPAPQRHHKRTAIVCAILAFLLVLASAGYFVFSHLSLDIRGKSGTDRSLDARANATRAAQTNPYIPGSTLIFSDMLKAANSNWERNAGCAFKGSGYHVASTTIQSCMLNTNITPTDFVLEVKATLLHGDVGGLLFRQNRLYNRSNGYLLDFDSKGNYQLWNYSISSAAKLIGYGVSRHFNTGYNQPNIIALIAQGSDITLYINRQIVRHFADSTYSTGGISLVSANYVHHKGSSEASYSDLRLWQL